jgi:hypothetical protein
VGAAILVPAVLTAPSGGLGAGGPGSTCAPYSPGAGTPWPSVVPNPVIPESSRGPAPDPSAPPWPPVVCGGATKPCPELTPTTAPRPSRPADAPAGAREACADAVPRLSSALAVAMGGALPGWGVTDSVDGGNRSTQWVFLRKASDATPDGYEAQLGLAKDGQISDLLVRITVAAPGEAGRGCAGQHLKPGATCRVTDRGDVLGVLGETTSSPPGMPTWTKVTDIRPDGTKVEVAGRAPVTDSQLQALAQAPGLTLFP